MKKIPHGDGTGNEYINALNKPYSTTSHIKHQCLPTCRGCGAPYRPISHSDTLCKACVYWHKLLTATEIAREAFRELHNGC